MTTTDPTSPTDDTDDPEATDAPTEPEATDAPTEPAATDAPTGPATEQTEEQTEDQTEDQTDEPPAHAASGTRFVFIDTEATGLDHTRHELTEVSWIVRFEDGRQEERTYFPEHTLDAAEPDALRITQYHERIAPQETTPMLEWLGQFLADAQDAVLVGAVPDFDARHLHLACQKLGLEPTWDHHLLDVETLALPLIADGPERPRSLAKTCEALGVEHDRGQAHGALYDARQAMRVFDRVWELIAELRESGDPLPPPVPRPVSGAGDDGGDGDQDDHGDHGDPVSRDVTEGDAVGESQP